VIEDPDLQDAAIPSKPPATRAPVGNLLAYRVDAKCQVGTGANYERKARDGEPERAGREGVTVRAVSGNGTTGTAARFAAHGWAWL
jgi:hypothetical protein